MTASSADLCAARRPWLAVSAIGLATFSAVTTELLPVGLLTTIAADLGTTTGAAGLMLSLPAVLAALFAPLVILLAGGMDRRRILCALLALLALTNAASALATTLPGMLAARMLLGICMGGIWAVAGGLARRLVPGHAVGLATSIIFGGVAAASVLGVPIGALIGDFAGWRLTFWAMSVLCLVVLALHAWTLPPLPVNGSARLRQFVQALGERRLPQALTLTLLLVAAHFMVFTFSRPLLMEVGQLDGRWIGPLLFGYGVAGIAGNFVAGNRAIRQPLVTLTAIAAGMLCVPLLFLLAAGTPLGASLLMLAWGLIYGGVSVALMTWILQTQPRSVEVASALYVSTFNTAIALGAWGGGELVDRLGVRANLALAAALTALALLLSCLAARQQSTRPCAAGDEPADRA